MLLIGSRWAILGENEGEVEGRVNIHLLPDPTGVYGAGWQPSTQAVLVAMESMELSGRKVLDAGCGNGILSIAAALSGAIVTAVDNDPLALEVARKQFTRNNVSVETLEVIPSENNFDIVLSNIGDIEPVEHLLDKSFVVTGMLNTRVTGGKGRRPEYKIGLDRIDGGSLVPIDSVFGVVIK